jgi:hypothetical protein
MGHVDDAHDPEDDRQADADHGIERSRQNAVHHALNKCLHGRFSGGVRAASGGGAQA